MDSVHLINDLASKPSLTEEEQNRIDINVQHLELMLAKDFWTDEDLAPFREAIATGKASLSGQRRSSDDAESPQQG